MRKVSSEIECLYCGDRFDARHSYFEHNSRCPSCGDKNLKVRKAEKGNVFGYPDDEEPEWDNDDDNEYGATD